MLLQSLLHATTGILTYRQPPDIYLQVSTIILHVEQSTWYSNIVDFFSSFLTAPIETSFLQVAQQEIFHQERRLHALTVNQRKIGQ